MHTHNQDLPQTSNSPTFTRAQELWSDIMHTNHSKLLN